MENNTSRLVIPVPGMIIKEDTIFAPGVYNFRNSDGIIIGASNITIDGNGAVLEGGVIKVEEDNKNQSNHEEFDYGKKPINPDNAFELGFYGIGIKAEGFEGITIKNLTVKGFDIGLYVRDGANFTIENNDFSDNFTDPAWGWDEHGLHGAIIFERVNDSCIRGNKATNVWDALNLRYSDRNKVYNNNFSHVSDVCLKLWNSCENEMIDNDFSYGIRIDPGEVHARDSSGLLIESGSNNNIFKRNDITHGGDGIFIRVLNGWMSIGNYFEENDCSYANNNAVEAWANGNTYVRNKANYSSYGFWLGGSDDTVMLENEAAFNGTNFRNAPEAFGNAGIAVVNGSSSHFKLIGNNIHDNNGPGVAIRFNPDYPAYHWIIEKNTIKNNRNTDQFKGHGIYVKNAQWLEIAGNDIADNEGEEIYIDKNTADVYLRNADFEDLSPKAKISLSSRVFTVGKEIVFDASESESMNEAELEYRWDLGDGTLSNCRIVKHTYEKPGFYRAGVTVNNGKLADLDFVNLYVAPVGEEIGTDKNAEEWTVESDDNNVLLVNDEKYFVAGKCSIHLSAQKGVKHILTYPKHKNLNLCLNEKNIMSFFLKFQTEADTDWARTNKKPVIRLCSSENDYYEYTPMTAYLEQLFVPVNEQKYEWKLIQFALGQPEGWNVNIIGAPKLSSINYIQFIEGPSTSAKSDFWVDCLQFIEEPKGVQDKINMCLNTCESNYPKPLYSYKSNCSSDYAPLQGKHDFYGDATERWSTFSHDKSPSEEWYGVDFGVERELNRLDIYFYHNPTRLIDGLYEGAPESYTIEYWRDNSWSSVKELNKSSDRPRPNLNRVIFDTVITSRIRVVIKPAERAFTSIYAFEAYNEKKINITDVTSSYTNLVTLKRLGLLLNKEHNEEGQELSDLILKLYGVEEDLTPGKLLKEIKISKETITFGKETCIDINYEGLESNKRYAVVLTQESLAKGRTEGDYYRWVTGGRKSSEYFGVYTNDNFKDETSTWGTAWLKVYTDKYVIDMSHNGEGLGNRLGLAGQEMRWQTFTIKDPVATLVDGAVAEGNGWVSNPEHVEDFIELSFAESSPINHVNIYLYNNDWSIKLPKDYRIQYVNEDTWLPAVIESKPESPTCGLNKIAFETITSDKIRIIFYTPKNATLCVGEVEVIKE